MNEKSKKEKKDLTVSQVDRQNILNNPYALQEIEKGKFILPLLITLFLKLM